MMKYAFCALWLTLQALIPNAYAQAKSSKPLGGHNNRAPVEITADALEVLQEQNQAKFSGNVVVIQGDVRLKADTMVVYYNQSEETQENKKDQPSAASNPLGADAGAVKKIDAFGHVFLSTRQETASGEQGTYDVEKQEIRLNEQVVLTRDKNVLKGDKLVYHFATGKSVLTGGAGDGAQKGERVRALFVPDSAEKSQAPAAKQGKK